MAYDNSIIAGRKDFEIYNGETWYKVLPITDANGDPINVSSFTVGPLAIYNHKDELEITVTGVSVSGTNVIINEQITGLQQTIGFPYYYKCPLYPANGPRAILHGKLKVYDRYGK
jgi:hypothetical protein